MKSTQILSILGTKTDFCVFSKTDSLADTSFLGGGCKKYLKPFNFGIQNIPLTTLSNTANRLGHISGYERSVSIEKFKPFCEYCQIDFYGLTEFTIKCSKTSTVLAELAVSLVRAKRLI